MPGAFKRLCYDDKAIQSRVINDRGLAGLRISGKVGIGLDGVEDERNDFKYI